MRLVVAVAALGSALVALGCADDTLVELPPPPPPQPDPPTPEEPTDSGLTCIDNSDCGDGTECASGTCVGVGVLQVTLTFPVDADYDLHVLTPAGDEIYFANPAADGGLLDVDQCITSCGPGEHVENIFFNGALLNGNYEAWAANYDGRDGGTFTINVSGRAQAAFNGELDAFPDAESEPFEFFVAPQ